jgi:hypothetical protein
MKTSVRHFFVVAALAATLSACGGGGGGGSSSTPPVTSAPTPTSAHYALKVKILPVKSTDTLVHTNPDGTTAKIGLRQHVAATPTLDAGVTNKIENGLVGAVNPTVTSTVNGVSTQVTCTNAAPQVDVIVAPQLLDRNTNDLLVEMVYPSGMTATYDATSGNFTGCAFTFSEGSFIVFADQTTQQLATDLWDDPTLNGLEAASGGQPAQAEIIPAHSVRNNSATPIINDLTPTGSVGAQKIFGSVRLLTYSETTAPTLSTFNFSEPIIFFDGQMAFDGTTLYTLGWNVNGAGYQVPSGNVVTTTIGATGSTSYQVAGLLPPSAGYQVFPAMFLDPNKGVVLGVVSQTPSGTVQVDSQPAYFVLTTTTATPFQTPAMPQTFPFEQSQGFPLGFTADGSLAFDNGILFNYNTGVYQNLFSNGDQSPPTPGASHIELNAGTLYYDNSLTSFIGYYDTSAHNVNLAAQGYMISTSVDPQEAIYDTTTAYVYACAGNAGNCASPQWYLTDMSAGTTTALTAQNNALISSLSTTNEDNLNDQPLIYFSDIQ